MALTPEEQLALAAGWSMPQGSHLISDGDDAIRNNAVQAHQRIQEAANIPLATPAQDGLMGSDDKTKLDGYPDYLEVATPWIDGLMGSDDKAKLDGYPLDPTELSPASVEDATRLDAQNIAFLLTNGQMTSPVELGMGRDGSNVLPTEQAILNALTDPFSSANIYLNEEFLTGRAKEDEVQTSEELITSTGWTQGAGWTGTLAAGFTHAPGNTGVLEWQPPANPDGRTYLVEWTITAPSGANYLERSNVDVTFAGGWAGITYQGSGDVGHYSRAIRAVSNAPLRFTPESNFVGRIHDISVKPVGSPIGPVTVWTNSAGDVTNEARMSGLDNLFFGRNAGQMVTEARHPARYNTIIGNNAGENLSTGFFNVGLGERSLAQVLSGSRNVGVGYRALENVESGDRNVGVGPFAGHQLVNGQRNVMVGTDVLYQTESSSDNIGIGYLAMHAADNLDTNIAIGRYAMGSAEGASQSVAIGTMAMRFSTSRNAVAIGVYALRNSTRNNNVAVGSYALDATTNDLNLVAVGYRAGERWTGARNTIIGTQALRGTASGAGGVRNVVVGNQAGESIESGTRNIIIGSTAAYLLRNGDGNILIGDAVNTYPVATGSNRLNIGNTIYGDLANRKIGIDVVNPAARLHLPPGGSEAGSAALKLHPSPTVLDVPEAGAFEYANGRLYFTTGNGRFEVQLNHPS